MKTAEEGDRNLGFITSVWKVNKWKAEQNIPADEFSIKRSEFEKTLK